MKLYAFEEVDEGLPLLPLAARRALDLAGLRLSRAGWLSLSLEARRALTNLGTQSTVDAAEVRRLAAAASPGGEPTEPRPDPPSGSAPTAVVEAFGTSRPVPDAVWAALSPLDRYVLAKVADKGRPERLAAAWAEIVGASALSTHLGARGEVRMVDVGAKPPSLRRAVAESFVAMSAEAFARLETASVGKGDVLATARLAGILAAKRTADLIPLCHAIALTHVRVDLDLQQAEHRVRVVATVETFDRTGVEMEALCAASVAALTVYDMMKAYDRAMELGPTRLLAKSGGRSGDFTR